MSNPGEKPPSGGLTVSVVRGFRWSMVDTVLQQAVRFVITVVLTRLIAPDEFGLLAMALVFTQLAALVGDLGLGPALVQRKRITQTQIDTATNTTFVVGLLLTVLLAALASPIASFYGEPRLKEVLVVLSITYVLRGIAGVPRDLLRRAMRFDLFVLSSAVAIGVSGVIGLILAFSGQGVWALVVQVLLESILGAIMAVVLANHAGVWSLGFSFNFNELKELARFGAFVSGTRVAGYGASNVDNFIVGKVLGSGSLGLYNLSYRLMLFPILKVADVVASVTMPALSTVQDDLPRVARAHSRAVQATGLLCFPLSVGIAAAAPAFVPAIFGNAWIPAIACVQILALNGVRLALGRINGAIYQATGKPKWDFAMVLATLAVYVVAFIVGVNWGIVGVAWGFTLAGYALFPFDQYLVARAMRVPFLAPLRGLVPVVLASLVMAGVCGLVESLTTAWGDLTRSGLIVVASVLTYGLALQLVAPGLLRNLRQHLLRR